MIYLLPENSPDRTLVLVCPTVGGVLNAIRKNFENIVDWRTTRVLVVFSARETEDPVCCATMRKLVMAYNFRLHESTRRYTALERRFNEPAKPVKR